MAVPESSRDDLAASLAARRELGADYDDPLIHGFVDRLDQAIDARVQTQISERELAHRDLAQRDNFSLKLAFGTMALAIPSSGIAATKGIGGIAFVWAGVAVINIAHALREWRRH